MIIDKIEIEKRELMRKSEFMELGQIKLKEHMTSQEHKVFVLTEEKMQLKQEVNRLRNHGSSNGDTWGKETEGIDADGLKLFDLSRIMHDDLRMSLDPSEHI